jgi:hypothetical protein
LFFEILFIIPTYRIVKLMELDYYSQENDYLKNIQLLIARITKLDLSVHIMSIMLSGQLISADISSCR